MPADTADSFHVSPQQEQLWLAEPDGPSGCIQAVVGLEGPLDRQGLEQALRQAIARHEILRTTFVREPGIRVPLQLVHEALEPSWEVLEAASADIDAHVAEALASERERQFDFERGPLLRGRLIQFTPDRHVLLLTLSTLCADTASMPVLVGELAHHYGGATKIADEPLQYADFSAWQQEQRESDDAEAGSAREFWAALDGVSGPEIPFTHASTASSGPDEVAVELTASASPAVVHAAWHALLHRVSGEPQVAVGYLSPDRRHADLEGALGAFARPVPISTDIDRSESFAALLAEIAQGRAGAPERQDYAPTDTATALTVGFSDYDGYGGRADKLSITLERILTTGHGWTLWLSCRRGRGGGQGRIHFNPACHERESVERLARQLQRLIAHAASDQSTPIGALELLDDDERRRILEGFNHTATSATGGLIHERFAAHAAAAPERDAVLDERRAISYAELDARANQLAHRLRALGVGPDMAVGLCADRSVEMVIGLLGILKAGGAYVPLNYEHPPVRLAHQLATAGARVVVTLQALLPDLPDWAGEIVRLDADADRAALDAEPQTAPRAQLDDENLAYVIYTSGSTGTPKGVGVTHGNLANYVADITRRLGADSESLAFGLVTSIATDLGNTSVFGALGSGGTLVLLSPAVSADASALARRLEATPIDVLKITPSHIGALLAGGDPGVLPRRTIAIGGERAPWDLVERIQALSGCAILNHYGPTEATIGCCTFAVENGRGRYEPATVPIGRPIANTSCYVLDGRLQPTPIGVPGSLFVGGAGVARGYIGQPELTAELFTVDPFASSPAARMYNTGDVVRWLPDGTLEFLGRADEQVKIRGYRVEPAEVETALRSHTQVGEALVVADEGPSGERRLIAYCTTRDAVAEPELRSHLAELLPEFMIPSVIVLLDTMPRTPSGKIDRLSLPDPQTVSQSAGAGYVAPRTPIEQAIVDVWSKTLGVERIGVEDDFFELGGHSLLATQVVAHVRSEFAVDLPLHSLFTCPTVELLAAEIVGLMSASEGYESADLLTELEGLSDEEAERLLADEQPAPDEHRRSAP